MIDIILLYYYTSILILCEALHIGDLSLFLQQITT